MPEVEVNEVLGFCASLVKVVLFLSPWLPPTMCDEAAKVPSYHTVPRCSFARIELKCVSVE